VFCGLCPQTPPYTSLVTAIPIESKILIVVSIIYMIQKGELPVVSRKE
jgi:hypothetical protein